MPNPLTVSYKLNRSLSIRHTPTPTFAMTPYYLLIGLSLIMVLCYKPDREVEPCKLSILFSSNHELFTLTNHGRSGRDIRNIDYSRGPRARANRHARPSRIFDVGCLPFLHITMNLVSKADAGFIFTGNFVFLFILRVLISCKG